MRRTVRRIFLFVALLFSSRRIAAQVIGLPVSYHSVMSGFGAAFDIGADKGGVRAFGLTGVVGLGHVTDGNARLPLFNVSGTGADLLGEGGHPGGYALGVEVSLLGSFLVGLGSSQFNNQKRLYVPLAAALPLVTCASTNKVFLVYAVPLWNFERLEETGSSSWQSSWGSVNVGMLYEVRSGMGLQAAVGGLSQHITDDPYHRVVVSVGIHWSPKSILKLDPASSQKQQCALGL